VENSIKLGQGLAWMAWLVFFASLFIPVETHSLAGPCAWSCAQPFAYYGWQNVSFFTVSIIAAALQFVQVIFFAIFDPQTLSRVLESLFTMGIFAVIGLGQILIVIAPFWPSRIKKTGWQKLHLGLVCLSALSVIAYGLFPSLRLGLDLLKGYYLYALSFVLMLLASILIYRVKIKGISTTDEEISNLM
jgi:hypothetical protein